MEALDEIVDYQSLAQEMQSPYVSNDRKYAIYASVQEETPNFTQIPYPYEQDAAFIAIIRSIGEQRAAHDITSNDNSLITKCINFIDSTTTFCINHPKISIFAISYIASATLMTHLGFSNPYFPIIISSIVTVRRNRIIRMDSPPAQPEIIGSQAAAATRRTMPQTRPLSRRTHLEEEEEEEEDAYRLERS